MISIVIPCYNEANAIEDTIKRCKNILTECGNSNSEIIVVNDGSNDNSKEVALGLGVNLLNHPHNIGYGRSLKDGIKSAQNDIIIITDADGTYPIEAIPDLLIEYAKGFDMVVGARTGKHYKESFFKLIFRRILKFLVEYTAGRKIPDINSGLRVFSKTTIMPYLDKLCDTFSFTTSLTLAYMMTGKFVKYIPISYEKRIGKTKVKHFRDALRTLQYIIEAILYYNPLKIFILISTTTLVFSISLFLVSIFVKALLIFYIFGITFFIVSILSFMIGLLAVLLKQIMAK